MNTFFSYNIIVHTNRKNSNMGVHDVWLYFHENGIRGIKTNNAKDIPGLVEKTP